MGNVLLGAVLAFAATLVVQFFVTPMADARRRRDEQWFRDVRDLMELIGGDLRSAVRSIQVTDSLRSMRHDEELDLGDAGVARFLEQIERDHRDNAAVLGSLLARGTWLSNRVLMVDPFNPDLMRVDTEWDMARVHLQTESYRPESEALSEDGMREAWGRGIGRLDEAERQLLSLARRARPPRRRRRWLGRLRRGR